MGSCLDHMSRIPPFRAYQPSNATTEWLEKQKAALRKKHEVQCQVTRSYYEPDEPTSSEEEQIPQSEGANEPLDVELLLAAVVQEMENSSTDQGPSAEDEVPAAISTEEQQQEEPEEEQVLLLHQPGTNRESSLTSGNVRDSQPLKKVVECDRFEFTEFTASSPRGRELVLDTQMEWRENQKEVARRKHEAQRQVIQSYYDAEAALREMVVSESLEEEAVLAQAVLQEMACVC